MEDVQCIQFLVPVRRLSLDLNVSGLRCGLGIGYDNKDVPFDEMIFLDTWDINSPMN
jgi:hypothetical protein